MSDRVSVFFRAVPPSARSLSSPFFLYGTSSQLLVGALIAQDSRRYGADRFWWLEANLPRPLCGTSNRSYVRGSRSMGALWNCARLPPLFLWDRGNQFEDIGGGRSDRGARLLRLCTSHGSGTREEGHAGVRLQGR